MLRMSGLLFLLCFRCWPHWLQANVIQLVYMDQPDLHLHPRAQVLLAQLLTNAANRGVRLVIETHSSLLLRSAF